MTAELGDGIKQAEKCPCVASTKVVETRTAGGHTMRRRICGKCGSSHWTTEVVIARPTALLNRRDRGAADKLHAPAKSQHGVSDGAHELLRGWIKR